ncbi:MAG TPA: peptidylprolyl isomerase, partial [Patescibacteria group bacterium]|nr:peptidylprolyl isomerase [Patescibacteria group bacterium]
MEHEHMHTEGSEHEEVHHEPKHKKSKNLKSIIIIVVAVILIILIAFLTWLYTGKLSQAKEKIFKKLPLPAAVVDMKFLSAKTVIGRIDLANQLASSQGAPASSNSDIYSQLIDSKKLDAIADHKHVSVKQAEIDEEYQNILKQYANGDEDTFKKELQDNYKMDVAQFKKEVVSEEILQSDLMLWFNNQKDLNKDAYDKAGDFQNQLNSGKSFDEVATAYTQDEATKNFAGDSQMIPYSSLLPEFRADLNDAKVGDVKLVVSRYGLHLLKVLEVNNDGANGAKQIHLQQIFIKPSDFSAW